MTASASSSITTHALPPERRMPVGRHASGVRQSRVHAPPIGTRRDAIPNKRVMDIEDALTWAFREELPKRRDRDDAGGPQEYSSISPMFRICALGGRVENFSREPGFPAAMGEAHPDALIIEAAVEELRSFQGHHFDGELGLLTHLPPGLDEHAAMAQSMGQLFDLVRIKARLGARPTFARSPEPAAVVGSKGQPIIYVVRNGVEKIAGAEGKDRYPSGAYCAIEWESAKAILIERADYAAWWAAVDLLAHRLSGKLASIGVLPPAAAQRPWAGEVDAGKPRRILDNPSSRKKLRNQQEDALVQRLLAHRRRNSPTKRPAMKAAEGAEAARG
ncbi:hypothetical protein MKK70_04840 [Methylobacterium sp. E-041]|uniref:hypothetical protein n=1 Tax=Methylobacterium sp. E-041 TaxID=2836573 RepID=UPI001FB89080|nr:hypothetical protein [Methylobacterium sp. E-041]MCJ2104713.1 hypothetical protein [Methylobacterium sp. E-041]